MVDKKEIILLELARLEYVARKRKIEVLLKLNNVKDIEERNNLIYILNDINEELTGISLEKERVLNDLSNIKNQGK